MKTEQIGINAESIAGGRALVVLPSVNPSIGPTFEIVAFAGQGYMLTLFDGANTPFWRVMLNAEGGVNGPDFGV